MQRDADDQQPHELAGVAIRECHVAHGPGEHADQQRELHAEALQKHGHEQHEQHFGDLAQRLLAGRILDANLRQELVRVLVVERERDADQDRRGEEHEEVLVAKQRESVEPQCFADSAGTAGDALRGCARQREAVDAKHQRGRRGHHEGVSEQARLHPRRRIPAERIADRKARDDPAQGAPHANVAEARGRIGHLPERDRVHERERRHVQDHVEQQIRVERVELRRAREHVHQSGADEMDHAE